MKFKYSISYFIILTAVILSIVYILMINTQHQLEGYVAIEEISEEIVISNSDDVVTEGYYLREQDGYVIVYLFDNQTIFQETDILISSLPESLQEEMIQGKYIASTEMLYSFLENYSS